MRRPQCSFRELSSPFRLIAHATARHAASAHPSAIRCPCPRSTKTNTGARTPSPSYCRCVQAAPSTFVSRGNAVRTLAGILHSVLMGVLRTPLTARARRAADSSSPPASRLIPRSLGRRHPVLILYHAG
ncbi:hypothetical protein C8R44DRAFT_227403 [Mycena epipterygia]|nr:hypothetical protein C8R44DRAFT_227403 [Mycena epipterygia]